MTAVAAPTSLRIIHTIDEMREVCCVARRRGYTIGLVPTMGALHAGHISLMRAARIRCGFVAATIFVNPLQFAANEDLATYPRTFAEDSALLESEGVDVLFAPPVEAMYPTGTETLVDVPSIGSRLDGASRPGHFRGVATVVTKLFNIVQPDRAFFGAKDAAQVAVLQTMVRDLNLGVQLTICPTVREPDGLAMSSRNRHLTPTQRKQALILNRTLQSIQQAFTNGERNTAILRSLMLQQLSSTPAARLDYAEVVDPATLEPITQASTGSLVAIAAHFGETRLIDNITLQTPEVRR
jgi:pantoate--beta-alanine ligase